MSVGLGSLLLVENKISINLLNLFSNLWNILLLVNITITDWVTVVTGFYPTGFEKLLLPAPPDEMACQTCSSRTEREKSSASGGAKVAMIGSIELQMAAAAAKIGLAPLSAAGVKQKGAGTPSLSQNGVQHKLSIDGNPIKI